MELTWIDDFIALCDTGNFTKAAKIRCTTQPAYSRRVQRLEEWIGAPLFNRETRPVSLTASGIEFRKRAVRLREDIMDMRRITGSAASQIPNALKIYTTNTIAIGILSKWIKKNKIKNYALTVSSVTYCIEAVKQNKCDIALIPLFPDFNIENDASIAVELIYRDRLSLICPNTLKNDVMIKGQTLEGPFMMYAPATAYAQLISNEMKKRKLSLKTAPICESASAEALLAQIKANFGCAWVVESILNPDENYDKIDGIFEIGFDIGLIKLN